MLVKFKKVAMKICVILIVYEKTGVYFVGWVTMPFHVLQLHCCPKRVCWTLSLIVVSYEIVFSSKICKFLNTCKQAV